MVIHSKTRKFYVKVWECCQFGYALFPNAKSGFALIVRAACVVYNDWYIREVTQEFSRFIHLFRIKLEVKTEIMFFQ